MEGVVDAVTRATYSRIGGFDRFVTEFVRVTDKVLPAHVFYRYAPELKNAGCTKEGTPVYVQLLGGRPEVVAGNAAVVASLGVPGIDLNFGCPAPTVNRHDGGAALLKNPHRVFDVVSAVRKAVPAHIAVTAKVRLGFDHKNFSCEIAQAADEGGAAMLTVHARTRDEAYRPPAHWEYIAKMCEVVKRATVVANGDIWTVADYWRCREISGCAYVALGRGAMATPDLALQIRASIQNSVSPPASHLPWAWAEVYGRLLPEFIRESEKCHDGGYAVARTKQWLRQLARGYPEAQPAFEKVKTLRHTDEIYQAMGCGFAGVESL